MPKITAFSVFSAWRPLAGATLLGALVATSVVLAPRVAFADEPSADATTRAADLKRQGGAAMDRLEFGQAEEAYRKALELTPNDATLHYNLGKVHQARGEVPKAVDELDKFVKDASPELRAKVPHILETLAELRGRVATLAVVCTETDPDAQLTIANAEVARGCSSSPTTLRLTIPTAGASIVLKVVSTKFRAQETTVALRPGLPIPVRVDLVPTATSGTLRVRTEPMGATVYVDGQLRGNPPLEIYLKPGSHDVMAKLDRYNDATVPVIIELDKTKDLTVPLSKGTPITQRWYFWGGVVAVVAAAVIVPTVIAMNTEKEPVVGSLGEVRAPLRF